MKENKNIIPMQQITQKLEFTIPSYAALRYYDMSDMLSHLAISHNF